MNGESPADLSAVRDRASEIEPLGARGGDLLLRRGIHQGGALPFPFDERVLQVALQADHGRTVRRARVLRHETPHQGEGTTAFWYKTGWSTWMKH